MEDVTLRLGGLAQNLDDPATRNVTVNVEGLATGVWAAEPKVARALGTRIDLFADAALPPGGADRGQPAPAQRQRPLDLHRRAVRRTASTPAATPSASPTSRSSPASPNRPLARGGRPARRTAASRPLSGGFDLTFDGGADDLAHRRRRGSTRCSPARPRSRAARSATRPASAPRTCSIANPQLSFASNGQISSTQTDIGFDAGARRPRARRSAARRGADRHAAMPPATGQPIDGRRSPPQIPHGRADGPRRSPTPASASTGRSTAPTSPAASTGGGGLDGLVLPLAGDVAVVGERPLALGARARGSARTG